MSLPPDESLTPSNGENGSVGLAETIKTAGKDVEELQLDREQDHNESSESRVLEYLQAARDEDVPQSNGLAFRRYRTQNEKGEDQDDTITPTENYQSPEGSISHSTPDDTPSLHVCI
jgi:hypothetical protein